MSDGLLIHPQTAAALTAVAGQPPHALLISGPAGMGKTAVALQLMAELSGIAPDKLAQHQFVRLIEPEKQSIPIEAVRQLDHFFATKMPPDTWRFVLISDGHRLTREAQNALLKNLEEPPARTLITITSNSEQALLPTIRSRVQTLSLIQPATSELADYFAKRGYEPAAIKRAVLMSGGLPGLMQALLEQDSEHPLVAASDLARQIVQATTFERLCLVDTLAKQRELSLDVLAMLGQMAHVALTSGSDRPASAQAVWRRVMQGSYHAAEQLQRNAQAKLVLTDLMLQLA